MKIGAQLGAYLLLRPLLQPLMRFIVRRRVDKGKDDAVRSGEKLGETKMARPEGTVIWVHAVGLGEVLALRPLLNEFHRRAPDMHFVITSTARSSAKVIGDNLPPNAVHQFLPLDGPKFVRRFLDHWRPALSIWSEQDFWPGAIYDTSRRGIPLAYINARINAKSYAKRRKMKGIYRALLPEFAVVTAQDNDTAQYLRQLGARTPQVSMSLKPAAEPLRVDDGELARFRGKIGLRKVWVAASTHLADEEKVLAAQALLAKEDNAPLLVLVPRVPDRGASIRETAMANGLSCVQRSKCEYPEPETAVFLADSFGELGLWYQLADVAFVGASFGGLGGHNPWEPACFGLSVLHGPATQNFATDYQELAKAGVTRLVPENQYTAERIAKYVEMTICDSAQYGKETSNAAHLVSEARAALVPLADKLLSLIGPTS
ncbi:3-deoxy-D-manno-octulosonic acid transferase [Shimia sp. SK013]|uniref:3-deoxy-D-manno-octulosonic acid transferase n=1 Tax=Shimia sp. SK013 TaxID=1389006 RepID=UPI00187BC54A|nr:glycosyltransferase N-terminal domain-containing protein [Shimia sp. SK013]